MSFDLECPPPDYTCRVLPQAIGWEPDLCPILFALQHSNGDVHAAEIILMEALQPTMVILILLYLDTRRSVDEPLPEWMVVYGAIYDHNGMHIRAYHPCVKPFGDSRSSNMEYGWGATWIPCGRPFTHVFQPGRSGSLGTITALSVLSRLQGHCLHVLQQLKSWDGYERVLVPCLDT